MDERSQFRTALDLAKRALDYIARYQTPPTPRAFEVFYTASAGLKPALNEALAKVIAEKRRVTSSDVEHLYTTHLDSDISVATIEQIGSKLREETKAMMGVFGSAAESTSRYQTSLESAEAQFATAKDPQSIESLLRSLVTATQQMAKANTDFASNLASSQAQVEELEQCLKMAREESSRDALTGLINRKRFDLLLHKAILYATDERRPTSILLIDIDDFKPFNDRYGHVAGDSALRFIASCIKANIQRQGIAARYGGDEFAIILPNTTRDDAATVGERIRQAVAGREMVKKGTGETMGRMSVSIGAAQYRPNECMQSLVDRADMCLYSAKAGGRNLAKSGVSGAPASSAA